MHAIDSNRVSEKGGLDRRDVLGVLGLKFDLIFPDHFLTTFLNRFFLDVSRIFSGRFFLLHILFGRTHPFEIPKFQNFIFRFFEIHKTSFAESSYADSKNIYSRILFPGPFLYFLKPVVQNLPNLPKLIIQSLPISFHGAWCHDREPYFAAVPAGPVLGCP